MNKKTARQDYVKNVFIGNPETIIERFKSYGLCKKCWKPKTYYDWCKSCNASHFRQDFDKWTSGNTEIDYFIQNTQIHAWACDLVLEWYPWSTFSDIEEIGKGGYGTVFRAKTKIGRVIKWHHQNNQWRRHYSNLYVALKTIGDSKSKNFMNEVI